MRSFFPSPVQALVLALVTFMACAVSCKRDGAKTTTAMADPASVAAIKVQFDVLRDSVAIKWRNMTESDDQKIGVTRLLLRELRNQPGSNPAQLQALDRANTRLKTRRYTQQSMASSALIDDYDNAQDSLLQAVYPVAAPGGNAPSENARNFVEGIQQLDAGVVGFRVQYDRAVSNYNDYLKLHRAELESLGGQYANLQPLSFFTIGAK